MNSKLVAKIDKYHAMTKEELAEEFSCRPSEICVGDYIARDTDDKVCPYKVITGFANFEGSKVESLGKLEIVIGKKLKDNSGKITDLKHYPIYLAFNIRDSKVKDLGKLKKVYGTFAINENVESLGNLIFLGSNLNISNLNLKDLGKLEAVDGMLSMLDDSIPCKIESLGNLKRVRHLVVKTKSLKDFGKLEEVKQIIISPGCNKQLWDLYNKNYVQRKKRGNKNEAQRIETDETITI